MLAFVLFLLTRISRAADLATVRVEITVSGIMSDDGVIRGALWHGKDRYLKSPTDAFRGRQVPAESGKVVLLFDDVPPGEYVFSVFHDENRNGQLDRGRFGIPREAYGFSNNAAGRLGPPSWDKASFVVTRDGSALEVRLIRHSRGAVPGA